MFSRVRSIMIQYDTPRLITKKLLMVQTEVVVTLAAGAEAILNAMEKFGFIKKVVIFMDHSDECDYDDLIKRFKKHNVEAITFSDLERMGRETPRKWEHPKEDDIALVLFSSGTMGDAKAVELTHKNLTFSLLNSVFSHKVGLRSKIGKSDVAFSYLPMSHVMEISYQQFMINCGGSIGFFSGDIDHFLEDVSCLRPTLFVSIPRFYNLIYSELILAINAKHKLETKLFKRVYLSALNRGKNRRSIKDYILEKLIFRRIRNVLGGRIRLFVSGSAKVDSDVINFFSICFSCPFIQSYGLTETSGAIAYSLEATGPHNNVGPPSCCVYIALAEVPSLGYYMTSGTSPRGEICVKGKVLCEGYFSRDPNKRELILDSNGWLHTGDIGYWSEDGLLRIVDRKVNIVPLKGGQLLVSEKVEMVFRLSNLVDTYISHARPNASFAVGVIFLNEYSLKYANEDAGLEFNSMKEAVENKEFREYIKEKLYKFVSRSGLVPSKVARHIYFEHRKISDLDIISPSYKIRRHVFFSLYEKIFNKFYSEEDESDTGNPTNVENSDTNVIVPPVA